MTATRTPKARTGQNFGPHPIDVHVGARIRLRRGMLGLSQSRLGDALDLTFQQVQKYERGLNRITAGRLAALSRVLDVPVEFFFDDRDPVRADPVVEYAGTSRSGLANDPLSQPQTKELVEAFFAIENTVIRRALLQLAQALCPSADLGTPQSRGVRRGPRPGRRSSASKL